MEIRLRSQVSRNAKGYSIEATLDIAQSDMPIVLREPAAVIYQGKGHHVFGQTGAPEDIVDSLSAFQINQLKKHMEALGTAFPRTEEE